MYSQMAEKRLRKELGELYRLQPRNCNAWPVRGDLMLWHASISGVRDTPYYLGIFMLSLKFNSNYPFIAPRVNFITKIYHCNVDYDGYICWDLLSSKWTPLITVATILHAICALMREPNPDDPCDDDLAALYRDNRQRYYSNAIDWTVKYAVVPSINLPPLQLECHTVTIEELDDVSDSDDEDTDPDADADERQPAIHTEATNSDANFIVDTDVDADADETEDPDADGDADSAYEFITYF